MRKNLFCYYVTNRYQNEIVFIVEESLERGFKAKVVTNSIFAEGENIEELKQNNSGSC